MSKVNLEDLIGLTLEEIVSKAKGRAKKLNVVPKVGQDGLVYRIEIPSIGFAANIYDNKPTIKESKKALFPRIFKVSNSGNPVLQEVHTVEW